MRATTFNGPEKGQARLVIRLRVTRRYRVRMWLAVRLIELAGWLTGYGIEVEKK